MKKNTLFILAIIPVILILMLSCYSLLLKNNLEICKDKLNNDNKDINDEIKDTKNNSVSVNIYNCQFTVTYRMVDLLDEYVGDKEEYSYVVVDKFQNKAPIVHKIPSNLKDNLEIDKYYEFTYTLKGTGNIVDIYDVIDDISVNNLNDNDLRVSLSINETNKTGLEQIQNGICK